MSDLYLGIVSAETLQIWLMSIAAIGPEIKSIDVVAPKTIFFSFLPAAASLNMVAYRSGDPPFHFWLVAMFLRDNHMGFYSKVKTLDVR